MKHSDETKKLLKQHTEISNKLSAIEFELQKQISKDIMNNVKVGDYIHFTESNIHIDTCCYMRIDEVVPSHNPYKASIVGPSIVVIKNKDGKVDNIRFESRNMISTASEFVDFQVIPKKIFDTFLAECKVLASNIFE